MIKKYLFLGLLFVSCSLFSQEILTEQEILSLYEQEEVQNIPEGTKIQLDQIGENNTVDVLMNANNSTQMVMQYGQDNVYNFTSTSSMEYHVKVEQIGDNNEVGIVGENQLTNNMKISQRGNDESLFIENE
ncbi:hypothetical protein [Aureivirga sp. CE67]|uniref:hypothetical protein n=1 Tax=Aureivirga sp. CE67 TaxID=1788983 RepID=UPI0018C9FD46|nr:hypothetical protein [Aureivirga sp. CE67]